MKRPDDLIQARALLKRAQSELSEVLQAGYPVDKAIKWKKRGIVHTGHVVSHGFGDRIRVRNCRTHRAYWIDSYDIVEAWSDQNG